MPLELKNVSYVYEIGTPNEKKALTDVSVTFEKGEFVGIIGHTGSGKSTMIQMLNGLIKPTSGAILLNGVDINADPTDEEVKEYCHLPEGKKIGKKQRKQAKAKRMLQVRQTVGLVFQYPEHQLFEMTIEKDIAFGPSNMGLPKEEIDRRVRQSMALVGLDESFLQKSPFELSGGQKRRVAIAGVLAMQPDYLILDEPTAGLDPKGRDEILGEMKRLQKETGISVLLVSHSMDDVARYTDRIVAMDNSKLRFDGTPDEVFTHAEELKAMGLNIPQVTELSLKLREKGYVIDHTILNLDQMEEWLVKEATGKC